MTERVNSASFHAMPSLFRQPESTSSPQQPESASPLQQPESADHDSEPSESLQQHQDDPVSRVRKSAPNGVQTVQEAYVVCEQLITEQLQRARVERPPPNVAVTGDASARNAILLLLTDSQQRDLFLQTVENRDHWSRLKPLFGAPPYNFLRPQDGAMFAASGFAKGRVNMSYDHVHVAANTSQFGVGQLVDEDGREYRLSGDVDRSSELLPGHAYFNSKRGSIYLQVKIKKQSSAKKRALIRSQDRKQVLFPQPNEVVVLRESKGMLNARGASVATPTNMRVRALFPRAIGGSTACLLMAVV